jgi:hypothetical protein
MAKLAIKRSYTISPILPLSSRVWLPATVKAFCQFLPVAPKLERPS